MGDETVGAKNAHTQVTHKGPEQHDGFSMGGNEESVTITTWQSIETAPKDGTTILACIPNCDAATCRWTIDPITNRGQWHTEYADAYEDDDELHSALNGSQYEPKYWMEIPECPKQ